MKHLTPALSPFDPSAPVKRGEGETLPTSWQAQCRGSMSYQQKSRLLWRLVGRAALRAPPWTRRAISHSRRARSDAPHLCSILFGTLPNLQRRKLVLILLDG